MSQNGFSPMDSADTADIAALEQDSWEPPIPLGREHSLPAFPVHCLPRVLRNYVEAMSEFTQTPADLAGVVVLHVVATTAGGRCRLEVTPGWREPCNLFGTVGMLPGARKSPVCNGATASLHEAQAELIEARRRSIAEATVESKVLKDHAAKLANEAARERDTTERVKLMGAAQAAARTAEEAVVPVAPRLLADDVTPEALVSLLAEQQGRIALISDEGGLFGILAGRYSSGIANLDGVLKAWGGSPIMVDRKGRPPELVREPALTMLLCVQPDVLRDAARHPQFRNRGLLARFLYSLPASNVGWRKIQPDPVPEGVQAAYDALVKGLALKLADWTDPMTLTLSPDALERFHSFHRELEPRLGPGGDLAAITDWGAKLMGHIARIAALLHLAGDPHEGWRKPIEGEVLANAITLGEYFIAHALAAFDLMGSDEVLDNARAVLAWIDRTGTTKFSARDSFNAVRGRNGLATMEQLTVVLYQLTVHGFIRPAVTEGRRGPGRPSSPTYEVNPLAAIYAQSAELPGGEGSADTADIAARNGRTKRWAR